MSALKVFSATAENKRGCVSEEGNCSGVSVGAIGERRAGRHSFSESEDVCKEREKREAEGRRTGTTAMPHESNNSWFVGWQREVRMDCAFVPTTGTDLTSFLGGVLRDSHSWANDIV